MFIGDNSQADLFYPKVRDGVYNIAQNIQNMKCQFRKKIAFDHWQF